MYLCVHPCIFREGSIGGGGRWMVSTEQCLLGLLLCFLFVEIMVRVLYLSVCLFSACIVETIPLQHFFGPAFDVRLLFAS